MVQSDVAQRVETSNARLARLPSGATMEKEEMELIQMLQNTQSVQAVKRCGICRYQFAHS